MWHSLEEVETKNTGQRKVLDKVTSLEYLRVVKN